MDECGVQPQGGHRDQLCTVRVRRAHRAQVRVHPQHVRTQTGPDGQERQPLGGGLQPGRQHPLVEFDEAGVDLLYRADAAHHLGLFEDVGDVGSDVLLDLSAAGSVPTRGRTVDVGRLTPL